MNKNVKKSAYVYLLFSLSRILIYICVSLLIFLFGHAIINYSLASYSKYIFISGGLFIVIIGILIALGKNEEHRFCQRLQGFFLNKDAKTVVLLGLIVGILPCAPLISVLVYIGLVARTWFYALLCGLSFGLGTAISPLFILTIFSGFITKAFIDKNNFYRIFNLAFGLIIVFLGIRLISRSFK
jgi:sulfite exporter TauE/SafE